MSRNRGTWLEAILALLGAVVSAVASIAVAARLIQRDDTIRSNADGGMRSQGSGAQRAPRDQGDQAATTSDSNPQAPTPTRHGGPPPEPEAPALRPPARPGWQAVTEPLPDPTYWPVVMAVGIVFIAWGVSSTLLLSGAGLLLFILALAGWIGDLLHAQHEHE